MNLDLDSLGDTIKELLSILALRCCETGEAPLYIYGRYRSEEDENNDEFESLKKALAQHGKELISHPAFSSPEEATAIELIGSQIRANHLALLCNQQLNFEEIKKRDAGLASLLINIGDDSGLLSIETMKCEKQWFEYKGKTIQITSAVPGSLNACLPLSNLLCSKAYPTLQIRPDAFRILPAKNVIERMELARTYGKPFNKKWLNGLNRIMIAQHDPDPRWPTLEGHKTQFIWEPLGNNEIQFSCEELPFSQDLTQVKELNTTRFLHGIYNQKMEVFTHFDGAIHIFTKKAYYERIEQNLKAHYKHYLKAKIFRIDTELSLENAELLLSNFYRWNSLVPEYFSHH